MGFRFTPGCECCDPCLIHREKFDAAAEIEDFYDVYGTGASIGGGRMTLDDDTIVITENGNPDSSAEQQLTINAYPIVDGWEGALLIGVVDDENFFFLKFVRGASGSVRLYQRSSGSDTPLTSATTTTVSEGSMLFVCYSNGMLVGGVVGGDFISTSATLTGTKVGVMTFSEGFQWDELFWFKRGGDCGECEEEVGELCVGHGCLNDLAPASVQVTIIGTSNSLNPAGVCSHAECDQWAGVYVVPLTSVSGSCFYRLDIFTDCQGLIVVQIRHPSPGVTRLQVQLTDVNFFGGGIFLQDYVGDIDCLDINEFVPFASDSANLCDHSGLVVQVTSL